MIRLGSILLAGRGRNRLPSTDAIQLDARREDPGMQHQTADHRTGNDHGEREYVLDLNGLQKAREYHEAEKKKKAMAELLTAIAKAKAKKKGVCRRAVERQIERMSKKGMKREEALMKLAQENGRIQKVHN